MPDEADPRTVVLAVLEQAQIALRYLIEAVEVGRVNPNHVSYDLRTDQRIYIDWEASRE